MSDFLYRMALSPSTWQRSFRSRGRPARLRYRRDDVQRHLRPPRAQRRFPAGQHELRNHCGFFDPDLGCTRAKQLDHIKEGLPLFSFYLDGFIFESARNSDRHNYDDLVYYSIAKCARNLDCYYNDDYPYLSFVGCAWMRGRFNHDDHFTTTTPSTTTSSAYVHGDASDPCISELQDCQLANPSQSPSVSGSTTRSIRTSRRSTAASTFLNRTHDVGLVACGLAATAIGVFIGLMLREREDDQPRVPTWGPTGNVPHRV
ncbi:unnamed protein product [Prorocentrum cordatum]|uniref:Uncharacterized protein n=1 Tax=Prorocentrum cordatum TaxID=2364126 RepID=A0ABN9XU33_9DINO|nr:unnamed protein product [Polarella glacialis]